MSIGSPSRAKRTPSASGSPMARQVPRLVDVLPNGPTHHPTVRVFLAGGVPEVMWHLRELGLLDTTVLTVSGVTLGEVLDAWKRSARRTRFRQLLRELDGVDPDDVILPPERARERGLTGTLAFPRGNLAPEGSVIKSTALDPAVVDPDGVFRHEGRAKVFVSEPAAMQALKAGEIQAGDIVVLAGIGPLGTGMEGTAQLTIALKHLPFGNRVTLVTDGRFSGVSTGACIGHVGPEALAGGPIGKVQNGDRIRVVIDRVRLEGTIDLVGEGAAFFTPEVGAQVLKARPPRTDLAPHPDLPADTRLWAALQQLGGGTWGGCVFDAAAIEARLHCCLEPRGGVGLPA